MRKLLKGIINLSIVTSIIFLMIPFNIHADTQIVPTYSSSAQSWVSINGQVNVTNYCEGTTAATNSCKLTFTVSSNWYGMIYFDGYDSSNTMWINYQPVFIADGVGEYNYNFWQSSQKVISKVNINIINLVKPDTTVDLSQIIQLLTAIENDTSAIDITLDNTLSQITNVLNQLIVSNGYLDTLTKIKQWNIPIESIPINLAFINQGTIYSFLDYYTFSLPIYEIPANSEFRIGAVNSSLETYLIFAMDKSFNKDDLMNYFNVWSNGAYSLQSDNLSVQYLFPDVGQSGAVFSWYKYTITGITGTLYFKNNAKVKILPIYFNNSSYSVNGSQPSTDFALNFGLQNNLLRNIDKIANGSTQSNQSASDLQQSTDSMQDQMDDMVDIESGYNQQFNNSLNNIDFTNPIQNNSGILPAANFVITVFNGLVNNPLSILIIIICILTIGKKVIGK